MRTTFAKSAVCLVAAMSLFFGSTVPAQAQNCWYQPRPDSAPDLVLCAGKTFRCEFPVGRVADWDNGRLSISKTTAPVLLIFGNVDVAKRTGDVVGRQGGEDVIVIGGPQVLHLIEPAGEGNMNMTSVFAETEPETGNLRAVHSRHIYIHGPIPSQYYGACEVIP